MPSATIVWLRNDLRLADNPALHHAAADGVVVPVFVWAPEEEGEWPPGAASRWWLHRSLHALDARLRERGSRLIVRQGASLPELTRLVAETGARGVAWNRRYEPAAIERDRVVKAGLAEARSHLGSLLHEPWTIRTGTGGPFRVFTPFRNAVARFGEPSAALPEPPHLSAPGSWPASIPIDQLGLAPIRAWHSGLAAQWTPGEAAASRSLQEFQERVSGYQHDRDHPARDTSHLSAPLHFGELSPRQVWHAVRQADPAAAEPYLRQLIWREFAHHLLYHFPHTPASPLRAAYDRMPWREDEVALSAWQRGETGYPLVDAGMRQLWSSGWMHNRARMVTASFLTKHLLIDWRRGAAWFWDTLVDADLANNTLGWQWVAGSGADAAPYHRIFNPVLQAERYDHEGRYQERWLGGRPRALPIVEHADARARALAAYAAVRNSGE